MKERFIEQDGKLFLKCEPEPLEMDSEMPCFVRLIQDNSRMGILNNKEARHVFPLNNIVISSLRGDYVVTPDTHAQAHYARFEVVGKHCSEGSSEWALWQMLNGKKVKHERDATNYYYMDKNGMLVSKGEEIIEDESRWLKTSSRNGWKIYEEPKPKPEVGKWYQHKKRKHYVCVVAVDGDECRIKFAGDAENERYGWMENDVFESSYKLAPIEPDFSNAKEGDKCFNTLHGSATISDINDLSDLQRRASPLNVIGIAIDSGTIDISKHMVDGKLFHKFMHPSLFHSAAQCAAYFAEVALKERGEQC